MKFEVYGSLYVFSGNGSVIWLYGDKNEWRTHLEKNLLNKISFIMLRIIIMHKIS